MVHWLSELIDGRFGSWGFFFEVSRCHFEDLRFEFFCGWLFLLLKFEINET